MKETIRRVVLGPKRRPVAAAVRKDIEQFLKHHHKTLALDGNRVVLKEGNGSQIPWERILETDIAPLLQTITHVGPKKRREEEG